MFVSGFLVYALLGCDRVLHPADPGQPYAVMTCNARSGALAVIEDEDPEDAFAYNLGYGIDSLNLIVLSV